MRIDGRPYRTIWLGADGRSVAILDQTRFPHAFQPNLHIRCSKKAPYHCQIAEAMASRNLVRAPQRLHCRSLLGQYALEQFGCSAQRE